MPELGKATYVIEIDSRDFERKLKALKKVTETTGKDQDRAISEMADAWSTLQGDVKKTTREVDKNTKVVERNRRGLRGLGNDMIRLNQVFSLLGKTMKLAKIPAMTAAIGLAVQAISALAGGAVALTSALAPLTGALVALPGLYGALGQAMLAVKLGGLKDLTEAMKGNEEAMKRLTPTARKLAEHLKELKPRFDNLKKSIQGPLFAGVEKGIKRAMQNFGPFRVVMKHTGDALGDLAARAGKLLGSDGFGSRFQKIGSMNTRTIRRLGGTALDLANALTHVLVAGRPLINWMTGLLVRFGKFAKAQADAGRSSGKLAAFFERTKKTMTVLGHTLRDLGVALYNIGKQAAPLGRQMLKSFAGSAKSFREWTESAKGKNKIAAYFKNIKPALWEAGRLLKAVTKTFFRLGQNKGLAPTLKLIRTDLLPVLQKFVNQTTQAFGPVLVKALIQLAKLFGTFAGTSGPLTVMVTALTGVAKAVNWLTDNVPGMKTLLVTMVAMASLSKGLKWAAWASGIKGMAKEVVSLASGMKVLIARFMATAAFGKLVAIFNAVKTAIMGIGFSSRAALMASGIGLVIVAATLIITHWGTTKKVLAAIWEKIKTTFQTAWQFIKKHAWLIAGAASIILGPFPLLVVAIVKNWGKIKDAFSAAWQFIKKMVGAIANVVLQFYKHMPLVMVVSAVVNNWGKIKDAFSSAYGFVKGIVKKIGSALSSGFSSAWRAVKGAFVDGINAVIDVLDDFIDIVNKLPFISIGKVGHIGGGEANTGAPGGANGGGNLGKHRPGAKKARGGPISEGVHGRDSVPALLERDEYVLNKKAVRAMGGPRALDAINFGIAPRFQRGGAVGRPLELSIGSFVGDAVKGAASVASDPIGAVKGAVRKGTAMALGALPDPSGLLAPPFVANIAQWTKDELVRWVEGEDVKDQKRQSAGGVPNAGPLRRFNHRYPKHSLAETAGKTRFSESLTARIARWAGLPGKLFGQIAHGESNFYPGVYGVDPGGTIGRGLWQITSGVGNDAMINSFGGPPEMFNPLVNARAARQIYDGSGIGAWYGLGYVTGKQRGGLVGMARGGRPGRRRRRLDPRWRQYAGSALGMAAGGAPQGSIMERMLAEARALKGTPYVYGGGHGGGFSAHPSSLDCSSAVSYVLHAGGLLDTVEASGALEHWGVPGASSALTVYANPGHAWMELMGHPWGTSVGDAGSGGLGFHPQPSAGYKSEFRARHPRANVLAGGAGAAGSNAIGGANGSRKLPPLPKGFQVQVPTVGGGGGVGMGGKWLQTEQLKFGPMPDSVAGLTKEIKYRREQLRWYLAGVRQAKGSRMKAALLRNAKLIRARIQELVKARAKLVRERKVARAGKKIGHEADFKGWVSQIAGVGSRWEQAEERAAQMGELEPSDEAAAKAYIGGTETPAYREILGIENEWRNTLIGAQVAATGKMGVWRERIGRITDRIHQIKALQKSDPARYRKVAPELPILMAKRDALRGAIKRTSGETIPGWNEQLGEVQGAFAAAGHSPTDPASLLAFAANPSPGVWGGSIWSTMMTIRDLGLRLSEQGEGGAEGDTGLAEIYKALATEARQRAAVLGLQMPNFNDLRRKVGGGGPTPAYGGIYHSGGVVPGPPGSSKTIIAEAGEILMQPGTAAAAQLAPHATVIVEDGAVNSDRIRVIWDEKARETASKSRRRIG